MKKQDPARAIVKINVHCTDQTRLCSTYALSNKDQATAAIKINRPGHNMLLYKFLTADHSFTTKHF